MNYSTNRFFVKISVIVTILFLSACEQDPKDIGLDFKSPDAVGVSFSDDLIQLQTSTVLLDSVNTHDSGILLVGSYTDPKFGKVTSSAYCQASQFDLSIDFNSFPVYDSLKLVLNYASAYGDTTKFQTLQVYRLTDSVKNYSGVIYTNGASTDNVKGYPVYNSKSNGITYESQPLGSIRFKAGRFTRPSSYIFPNIVIANTPSPTNTSRLDTLTIRLRDDVGRDLFNQALIGNLNDINNFKNYFKGIALVSSDEASVTGFAVNGVSAIRLYYHYNSSGTTVKTFFDFPLVTSSYTTGEKTPYYSHHFSRITGSRSGTVLSNLQNDYQVLPASGTGEEVFVQSGIGIGAKIDFTNLEALKNDRSIHINTAELLISPTVTSNGSYTPPPLGMILYQLASTGRVSAIRYTNGEVAYFSVPQESGTDAQIAVYDELNNVYRFRLTSYLQSILAGTRNNYGFLLAPVPTLNNSSVTRLVAGSSQNSLGKMKIRIYYTKLK